MINTTTPHDLPDTLPELSDLVPDIPEDDFGKVHQQESIQLLGDLGYLSEELFIEDEIDNTVFKAAIDQFRDELKIALEENLSEISTLFEQTGLDDRFEKPDNELTNEEIQLLGEFTAIEGALPIPDSLLKDVGSETASKVNLFTRILHYRLKLLTLYAAEIDKPINSQTREAITKLGSWLGIDEDPEILTISGDVSVLAKQLCKLPPTNQNCFKEVVYFQYERVEEEQKEHRNKELIKNPGTIFLDQLDKDIHRSCFNEFIYEVVNGITRKYKKKISGIEDDIRTLKTSINNKIAKIEAADSDGEIQLHQKKIQEFNQKLKKKEEKLAKLEEEANARDHTDHKIQKKLLSSRDYSYVEQIEKDPLNQFMIRVLQLLAWTHGLYEGRLDNIIGDMTYDSIEKLIEFENSLGLPYKERDTTNIHKILIYLGNDYWALNITYYFELFVQADKQKITNEDKVSEIFDRLYEKDISSMSSLTQEQKNIYNNNRKKIRKELEDKLNSYPEKLKRDVKESRKKYHGTRKILRFFKRIGKNIMKIFKKIGKFFKGIFKVLKNGIATIFSEIKDGFRKFYRGMKFLFSKRVINLPDNPISTDFDFDFDSITTISAQPTTEEMNTHLEKCKDYTISLRFSLRLVGKVIDLAQSLKLGWVGLGIKIASMVRSVIQQKLRDKQRFTPYNDLILPIT